MAKILVVDDHAITREFLVTLLSYSNHQIVQAINGLDALEKTKAELPDLIITDILMPKMNGYEFVKAIRNSSELSRIPVIFYTATYRLEDAAILAMACQVKYVLPKPSEPQKILEVVKKALEDKEQNPPVDEVKPIGDPELKKVVNDYNQINERFSEYLSDINNIKQIINSMVAHTQATATEQERLANISKKTLMSLDKIINVSSRLFTLLEFNYDIFFERDLKKMLRLFCRGAKKILGAQYCVIGILKNGERDSFKYYAISNNNNVQEDYNGFNKSNRGFINQILTSRTLVKINNIQEQPQLELPPNHPTIKSLLGVPIVNNNTHLYGFIYFADKIDKSIFEEVDIEIAVSLTAEFALLYENIELNRLHVQSSY